MKIKSSEFVISSTDVKMCPAPALPEYAFIGRSNVGKSSLINMLTDKKELAHTSSKPGKTQLINHYLINEEWYLVDLPGYGYATLAKEKKQEFDAFVRQYLLQRTSLLCVFVLIDSRLPMQPIDKRFMEWLAGKEIPFTMVFTKTDKLGKTQLEKNLTAFNDEMLKSWEELPTQFITSAHKKTGGEDILKFITKTNTVFKKPVVKHKTPFE
jgi:GTP-binding protein